MKKILGMLLCLCMMVGMLVSCGERVIGEYLPNYNDEDNSTPLYTFNLYVVCDDATTDNAKETVKQNLTQYTEEKFNTKLNVIYVSAADYQATVLEAVKPGAQDRADIILINKPELATTLIGGGYLEDLTAQYASKAYGTLNVQIASALLEASKYGENNTLYTVPNNRVLGEYEYVLIDKAVARAHYYSDAHLAELVTAEKIAEFTAINADTAAAVEYRTGGYADKAAYEADGKYVNVIKAPVVTEADAFASAFAVVNGVFASELTGDDLKAAKDERTYRAMEIIYALNTDTTFHNLFLYGIDGTNYKLVDGNVDRFDEGNNVYHIDLSYAGDVFKSYYCAELNWTKSVSENGKLQNSDAIHE